LEIIMTDEGNASSFVDIKVHVRFKLFALWSSVMFFYIYGDYFELYQPGKLQDVISGRMPFGAISQGVLLGMAAVMVIPSLSVTRLACRNKPLDEYRVRRGIQRDHGSGDQGGWHYYVLFGLIEITLTILIVWYAWTWPKQPTR
jgi:hypothetical protein